MSEHRETSEATTTTTTTMKKKKKSGMRRERHPTIGRRKIMYTNAVLPLLAPDSLCRSLSKLLAPPARLFRPSRKANGANGKVRFISSVRVDAIPKSHTADDGRTVQVSRPYRKRRPFSTFEGGVSPHSSAFQHPLPMVPLLPPHPKNPFSVQYVCV